MFIFIGIILFLITEGIAVKAMYDIIFDKQKDVDDIDLGGY